MANLFPSESKALITSSTVVVNGDAMPCRGYSVVVADVTIDSTAQVNFEASADGGTTYRYIIGAPTIGTAGTTSATASGHFRFNVAGMDFWRPVAATVSVGAVSVAAIGQAGGTDAVVSQTGGSSITQGGPFDVRLIASTATIGAVTIGAATVTQTIGTNLQTASNQSGPWDVRLIASTPTIGSVNIGAATVTQTVGTNLQTASNQAGTWDVRLVASTPTIGTVNIGQADVRLIAGTATAATVTVIQPIAGWPVQLIASTPTIGAVTQGSGWDVRLIAGTATAATVTAVNRQSNTAPSLATQNIGLISTTTLAANASRLGWWIQNTSKQFVYLGFGQTPTSVTYHMALTSCTVAHDGTGGSFFDTLHKGAVNAICGVATGTVTIGEWVP